MAPPAVERRNRHDERGATMVEFALVSVVLFTIIFGLIEGGLAVRARNAINNATDDAARKGAVAGSNDNADWLILRQLRGRGINIALTVNHVVVYRAETGSAAPSDTCKAGTAVAGDCNVYTPDAFEEPESAFDCSNVNLDANWCPADRANGGGFEYVGVYVDAKYQPIIGTIVFDSDITMTAASALPIENSGSDL